MVQVSANLNRGKDVAEPDNLKGSFEPASCTELAAGGVRTGHTTIQDGGAIDWDVDISNARAPP
jgi:hypothetical protein